MIGETFLRSLGLLIVAAAIFALGTRRLRMPSIVAYLLAGLTVGPLTGLVQMSDALELISEAGIALLLFLVGLELSLVKVREIGRVAVLAGLGQVVFTAVLGFALCWLLGFNLVEAVVLAIALTFSSTVVVVKLLVEKREMDSLYGRIAVGIFLVQDLVAIVMLTFLAGLGTRGVASAGDIVRGVLSAFGGMIVLSLVMLAAARWVLPKPFAWAARSPETLFIWGLCWCFLAVLAAHALHLSLEIGAFLAGLSLAQLPYNQDLRRRVYPLMNFFIAVFFVSLGVQMELGAAMTHGWSTLLLSLFVIVGNPIVFIWIIARMGYSERTSFFTGVTVAQISEFSFILVAMGVKAGLVSASILSLTALVGVVTIVVSAYLILFNEPLYRFVKRAGWLRIFRAKQRDDESAPVSRQGHIIVAGMNTLGRELVRRLCADGQTVLAIDTDPAKLADLRCDTLLGNADNPGLLEDANLPHAALLVSALKIEEVNDMLAHRCRSHGVRCAINVMDLNAIDNLMEMNPTYLMVPKVDGVKEQARTLKEMGIITR